MASINLTEKEKRYLGENWRAIKDRLNIKCNGLVFSEIDKIRREKDKNGKEIYEGELKEEKLIFWKEKLKNSEGEYKKLCLKQIKLIKEDLKK